MGSISIREAVWQAYLSRAGSEASVELEQMAGGESLGSVLRRSRDRIAARVHSPLRGELPWRLRGAR